MYEYMYMRVNIQVDSLLPIENSHLYVSMHDMHVCIHK